ncbi:winged helix-turn-helix domain-containing protein [Halorussus halobius]|uniref:winged helix-turn-helix domain-containing protein n=1 Tax=Halorussus halobius TaxID=1710537 RepID=UPI0010932848|nr:winged helix-turn-helix domain-containing protein [Halorussus halobius]
MTEYTESNEVEWDFKDRDVKILTELSRNPEISSRELADRLEEEHGIDVSHVTVSETIRKMREAGVYREAIMPNESFYNFALFEFKFNTDNFDERWEDAMEAIERDKQTLMFFISNGEYQWKSIMMFRTRREESQWIHEFYKEYGDVVSNIRNSVVHNLLKFRTDPEIFELLEVEE